MKKLIWFFLTLAQLALVSCDNDNSLPDIVPEERGTVTDNEGNVYEWVRIGDQLWTTTNALNGTPMTEKEYFDNWDWENVIPSSRLSYVEEEYIPMFGNLMNFDDAVASAPEGWRLPSDEDWQKLECTLGMKNTASKGWRGDGVAYKMQEKESGCGLGLLIGGSCALLQSLGSFKQKLDFVNEYGYYWTSTVSPDYDEDFTMCYYRKITVGNSRVVRECMRSECMLSVRWVKDAE